MMVMGALIGCGKKLEVNFRAEKRVKKYKYVQIVELGHAVKITARNFLADLQNVVKCVHVFV